MHRIKRLLLISLVLSLFIIPSYLFAGVYDLNIIDTPKAYASYKGDLQFEFSVYNRGGILTSAVLAITDYVFLGIYFDAGGFIGNEKIELNQPGVLARFLVSDGSSFLPPIALGYSYFMKGEHGKVNNVVVSGLYAVISHNFYMFGNDQNFSYGLRYPIIPLDFSAPENITVFAGTDIEISPAFSIKGEIENVQFTEGSWRENFYNFAFDFNIIDLLSIMLEFKYSPSIETVERNLTIGYYTQF